MLFLPKKYILIFLFSIIIIGIQSCKTKEIEYQEPGPEFSPYISAYTAGTISKASEIVIRFTQPLVEADDIQKPLSDAPLKFTPNIKGEAFWKDRQTLVFKPENHFKPGQRYRCEVFLSRLMNMPENLSKMAFTFDILNQSFEIQTKPATYVDITDLGKQKIEGTIFTADIENTENIQKILSARQDNKRLNISWQSADDLLAHHFTIEGIIRHMESSSKVEIEWNGNHISADVKGKRTFNIPSLREFKITDIEVIKDPETQITVTFSDPLNTKQDLSGLIQINNTDVQNYMISGQQLHLYPQRDLKNEVTLTFDKAIQNIIEISLQENQRRVVRVEQIKPAVNIRETGTIMPVSGRILFPFEAVNLKAVDIAVFKIAEKNIPQFLQVNRLGGNYELRRTGSLVAYKTVRLDQTEGYNPRIRQVFSADLTELVEPEPGAIYHVTVMFNPSYSTYNCQGSISNFETFTPLEDLLKTNPAEAEKNYWRQVRIWPGSWRERNNPCDISYYNNNRWAQRNLLASDIGITAKMGTNNKIYVFVNDINTTAPIRNADIDIYNFQQEIIGRGKTSSEGKAEINFNNEPYLVIVSHKGQKNYLRVDNNTSLSLSRFDVSGQEVQEGLKGFIYGERDVWRPGDTLFLNFILEGNLPMNHPVRFSIYNPRGVEHKEIWKSDPVNGIYSINPVIPRDAETGNWQLVVKAGNAVFNEQLRIETIMPNRLKSELKFKEDILSNEVMNQLVTLKANWLHGASASGLKADIYLRFSTVKTQFSSFHNFSFDDPSRRFNADRQKLFEGNLNQSGEAEFTPEVHISQNAPGMLRASFTTRIFEAGGNFSTESHSLPFHPYDHYVGLKAPEGDARYGILTNDKSHEVELVAIDKKGNKVNREVEVSLYKIEWRWWWDSSGDEISAFNTNIYENKIAGEKIFLRNGSGKWSFQVKHPDWGRYLLRVCDNEGEHCSGEIIYIDWPGWSERTDRDMSGASLLNFFVEKDEYEPGEKIKINIPGPENGRALVSIENGKEILDSYWVKTQSGITPFEFTAKGDWAPNIYIHVHLLQPHAQSRNNRPLRMYGVVPVNIINSESILNPVVTTSPSLKPEENAVFEVKEKNGKPMAYTLAIVDEGLLNITRFQTPDPWNHFYSKEALGIRTWDMYDDVTNAFTANLSRLLAIGGDMEIKAEDADKANRFRPVVKHFGPYMLNAGQTATHQFQMPNYIGSVRAMVVAANNGTYGSSSIDVPVKKPLMVLTTLPRVLSPNEEVNLTATVFGMEDNLGEVVVRIESNDLFEVIGPSLKTLNFDKKGEKVVYFRLKTNSKIGIGKVKTLVSGGREEAYDEIELDIRNPNPYISTIKNVVLNPGETWNYTYSAVGISGTNECFLELSSAPSINLTSRLNYLTTYPHGCLEQTVSAVFPQLFLSRFTNLNTTESTQIQRNIQEGINKIRNMQLSNGGIAYWQGQPDAHQWSTTYAGHFIIEAEKAGYPVPGSFKSNWQRWMNTNTNNWQRSDRNSEMIQAYRLFVLALNNTPNWGAMNRMRNLNNLYNASKWYLGGAYHIAGREDVAAELLRNQSTSIPEYTEMSGTFGSTLRDKAIILYVLSIIGNLEEANILAREISNALSSSKWISTQTTAFCLIAMSEFQKHFSPDANMDFTYTIQSEKLAFSASNDKIWTKKWTPNSFQEEELIIKNESENPLYIQLIKKGQPLTAETTSASSNLLMEVSYLDISGNPIDISHLKQGTDFIAQAKIHNPGRRGDYKEMALTWVFPSIWEIHNERLSGSINFTESSSATYTDIRDDRIYTYFDIKAGETKIFHTVLNASYAGKATMAPVSVEAMYNNSIFSRSGSGSTKVYK
ncbi:MAG: hypothetical protein EA412_13315 [Chitinophagaceae bacterium]|nr:MAG: hypothetical protein EA412_13315 [Chitinophagaceae bacterium]